MYISLNISHIRSKLGLNKTQFAEFTGIDRRQIGSYEEGSNMPSIENIKKISDASGINIDDLIKVDLSSSDHVVQKARKNANKSASTNYFVPLYVSAGYLSLIDQGNLRDLEEIYIPGIKGDVRTFEIDGDSMVPTLNSGDLVCCKKMSSIKMFRPGSIYVVVTLTDGITVKRLYLEGDLFKLVPDNSFYGDPYYLPVDEVLELWRVKMRVTKSLSLPRLFSNK